MTRLLTSVCLVASLSLTACTSPNPSSPESPSATISQQDKANKENEPIGHYLHANKEALGRQTFQNAYKLERAVWRFAADNDGVVPSTLSDRNLAGKTLYDYLPGKKQMFNPFTRQRSEPRYGIASAEGQVCYLEIRDPMGYLAGFTISAMGVSALDQYLQFDRYMPDREPLLKP